MIIAIWIICYDKNFINKKKIANPDRKIIPAKLKIFKIIDGWDSLSKKFPVTNLKLKIAIIGAMTKDKTVAKSTSSFRLFPNWNITVKEPTESNSKKIT